MKEQMTAVQTFVMSFLELSVLLLAFALGIGLLAIAYMYIVDITQKIAVTPADAERARQYALWHREENYQAWSAALVRERIQATADPSG